MIGKRLINSLILIQPLLVWILALEQQTVVVRGDDREEISDDLTEDENTFSDDQFDELYTEDEENEQTVLEPRGLFSRRKECQFKWKIFKWGKARKVKREGWMICVHRCEDKNRSFVGYCRRFRLLKNKCSCHVIEDLPLRLRLRLQYLLWQCRGRIDLLRGEVGPYTYNLLYRYQNEVINRGIPQPIFGPHPAFAHGPRAQSKWERFWNGPDRY